MTLKKINKINITIILLFLTFFFLINNSSITTTFCQGNEMSTILSEYIPQNSIYNKPLRIIPVPERILENIQTENDRKVIKIYSELLQTIKLKNLHDFDYYFNNENKLGLYYRISKVLITTETTIKSVQEAIIYRDITTRPGIFPKICSIINENNIIYNNNYFSIISDYNNYFNCLNKNTINILIKFKIMNSIEKSHPIFLDIDQLPPGILKNIQSYLLPEPELINILNIQFQQYSTVMKEFLQLNVT